MIDTLSSGVEGGAERFALETAVALDRAEFERLLIVTRFDRAAHDDDTLAALERLRGGRVALHGLDRRRRLDMRSWWSLFKILRTVDVAHSHKYGSNFWVSVIGSLARVPVIVVHEHSWSYSGDPVRRLLDRFVISPLADAVVAVSDEDARRMAEIERIAQRKIHVIPNGVPPAGAGRADSIRTELRLGSDPVICSVCGLRPEKRLDVLVDAFGIVARTVSGARLVIAGQGPERETIRLRAERQGLGARVHLLGARTDTSDIIEAADVCVLSSDREGLPLAIMEYMERSRPVVATRVGGVAEMLTDGAGITVGPRDPAALADAIVCVLRDRDLASKLGANAHARWHNRYSMERVARDFAGLYRRLLSAHGGGRPRAAGP